LLLTCLREAGSLLSKLADDRQADRTVGRIRDLADDSSMQHALQVQTTAAVQ
jgi:hypothetical protein